MRGMTRTRLAAIGATFAACALTPCGLGAESKLTQTAAAPKPISVEALAGTWVGTLQVQSQSLTLVFNLRSEDGKAGGTIDSPDQGAKGIPISTLSLDGEKLRIESAAIRGTFVGTLSPDVASIAGAWSQGNASYPLELERRAAPALSRPQEPKSPFPYRTEELRVANAKAGIELAGTLVIPAGEGPFPAVVFATGSGAQNRDEELMGHKPFLVIADYLARRGIASLRCDDRGVGGSTGDAASATTMDKADDAEAAFEYLASRPEARKGAVGIIGHSEGGVIAPIVASRNARVGFVVLLAGPGLVGEELLYLQGALIARAARTSEAEIAEGQAVNRRLYAAVRGQADAASAKAAAEAAYLGWVDSSLSMGDAEKAEARKMAGGLAEQVASPWFRTFLSLDPAPYLARLRIPVLALNGSKDLQVPAKEDLAAIKAALGKAANRKNKLVELKGLNHLFQHAGSGSPDEYGRIEETFAPEALKAMGDWILGL